MSDAEQSLPMEPPTIEERLAATEAQRDSYAGQLAQIRASMREVSVYEGLVDISPVVMMVSDLARDHEELEQRIENALVLLAQEHREVAGPIIHVLRGGSPFPDTIEGLETPPGS